MSVSTTKILFAAASLSVGASMMLTAGGCANALSYAKDDRATGMSLYNDGNYVEATAAFSNATRQDPRDFRSYYYEGASYEAQHKYQQAISCYRASLDEMPLTLDGKNSPEFRNKTIDSLATAIAHSESHGIETAALEKKCAGKASVEDQWLLAKVYRYTGDADAAIDAYTKAILIEPDNFTIAKEAGLYEAALGQAERAQFALKKAHAADGSDAQVNDALRDLGVAVAQPSRTTRDLSIAPSTGSGPAWDASHVHTDASEASSVQTPRTN